jgi:hypothetical protein
MFNKTIIATAIVVATTARRGRGRGGESEPFTSADLPRIQGLFDVFDENKDGSVEPKEIWAAHEAMSGDDVTKKAFMMRMDAGTRTFCGVPQVKVAAMPVSRRGRRGGKGGKGGKSSRGGRGNRGKANKRGGKGKKNGNGMKATKKMFMQFAIADADFDMQVSPMEMGTLM